MSDIFDLREELPAPNDSMKRLIAMAEEAVATEKLVLDLEENLSSIKKNLNNLKTVQLPDAMAEAGIADLSLESGFRIAIEDFVAGSLPKDEVRRDEAIKWLENHGAESLIKTSVNVSFEKTQHNMALSIISELADRGLHVTSTMGVHPQTLIAHIKERLRSGDEVPLETLGLFAGRIAKIKPTKGGKK